MINKIIKIIFIIAMLSPTALSESIQWYDACSVTVHPGQIAKCEDFTLSHIQFSSPVKGHIFDGKWVLDEPVIPEVTINISKSGKSYDLIELDETNTIYQNSDNQIKITASGFTARDSILWEYEHYNPQATLSIQLRDYPKLEVSIDTDADVYNSMEDLKPEVTINVKNIGNMIAENVGIELDTEGLEYESSGDLSITNLQKQETRSVKVRLKIQKIYNEKSYNLIAIATSKTYEPDRKEVRKQFNATTSIKILPGKLNLMFLKYVKDRIYDDGTATVVLTISNSGNFLIKNIEVKDSITDSFVTDRNNLSWSIKELAPASQQVITYIIKPKRATSETLSQASLKYELYGKSYLMQSNMVPIKVISTGKIKTDSNTSVTPQKKAQIDKVTKKNVVRSTNPNAVNTPMNFPTVTLGTPAPNETTNPRPKISGFEGAELIVIMGTIVLKLKRK